MLRTVESPIENELEAHRKALTGYCYRMIGSGAEAEDAVQETMVRAWKAVDKLQERGALKAWLYRIANNVCLDMLQSAQRRAHADGHGPVLQRRRAARQPVARQRRTCGRSPTRRCPPTTATRAELAADKESLRLAFVAALQHLPAKQRAVLILREVLRWQASEVAELLDTQRGLGQQRAAARPRDDRGPAPRGDGPSAAVDGTDDEKACSPGYVKAFEAYDMSALVGAAQGRRGLQHAAVAAVGAGPGGDPSPSCRAPAPSARARKLIVTAANGGPGRSGSTTRPRTASSGLGDRRDGDLRRAVSGLHHFIYPDLFAEFGLPLRLDEEHVGQPDELQQPA